MEQNFNYDDFYLELVELIENKSQEYGIDYKEYLKTYNSKNALLHKDLIDFITNKTRDYKLLTDEIKYESASKNAFKQKPELKVQKAEIYKIIDTYIYDFIYKGFIDLEEPDKSLDKLKFTHASTPTYYQYMAKHNDYNNLVCIVLKDGTCLLSKSNHDNLIKFLCVNGINLNDAIRLEQEEASKELSIDSLKQFRYMLHFDSEYDFEKSVEISPEQIETITQMYKVIKSYKKLSSIEDTLIMSSGFGIREGNGTGDANIRAFKKALNGDLDSRYISQTVREHNLFGTAFFI